MIPRRGKKKQVAGPQPPTVEELLDRMDGYLDQTRDVVAQARAVLANESTQP